MAKKGLGRGLGALFNEESFEPSHDNSTPEGGIPLEVKITQVEPNKDQPRKEFDKEALASLAESISQHGIIQPLVVKELDNGFYQIIAGERRWRAARIAGLKTVPVILKDYDKKKILEVALIENLQREDLNPIEEAEGYKNLLNEFSMTQEEISKSVGKSRSAVANSLRLLNLPAEIQTMLSEGQLSPGHSRAILAIEDKHLQVNTAKKIIEEQLSVREAEALIKTITTKKEKPKTDKTQKMVEQHISDLEKNLSKSLGTKVKIMQGKNKGKIEIEYFTNDDFDRIISMLNLD